jgi:hypothetical protein
MANTFLKPTVIVNQALGLLQREIVLPGVVWRDARLEQAMVGGGAYNDTVSLKLPAVATARELAWRTGSRTLTADDLAETKVDVALEKHPYHLANITDEQLTLDISNFGVQVQQPQIRAIAEKLESYIADELNGGTYDSGVGTIGINDGFDAIVDARAALNAAKVPMGDRFLVVSSDVEAKILKSDLFRRVDQSGTNSALREASIGQVAGFTVVVSQAITAGMAYAMHRTAVAFLNIAPQVPQGAASGARSTFQGLALTWLRDYDPNTSQDRSLTHSFAGATLVMDDGEKCVRAVPMSLASSIAVSPATKTLAADATQQLTVTATLVDSSTTVVTNSCTFSSSAPSKATVDENGLVTAVATGSATITASYGGETATCAVTVS